MFSVFYSRILLFLLSIFILAGCQSTAVFHQTTGNVADVKERIDDAHGKMAAQARGCPSLLVKPGLYVDRTPIWLAHQPCWLKNRIVIRGDQLPFSYYSRVISSGGGPFVLTHYQVGMNPAVLISMNYSGTVKGALDLLAARTGFVYSVTGCNINWKEFVTRTFDVAFMPGSSDYLVGKTSSGASGTGSSGGGGGTVVASQLLQDSAASQYSNLKGTLSVWKDIRDTIQQMLSPEGRVIVSESTTTVTVRDRSANVNLIGHYICNLNHTLSKQVMIKVQVLEVQLNNDYNYGINWSIVNRFFGGTNFALNANYGTPLNIVPLSATPQISPLGVQTSTPGLPQIGLVRKDPNSSTGISILINALTQQGRVSSVTEPSVVSLNNQVAVIRIVNTEGYLASVQNTTVPGSASGSATVTSQITPGSLITGLTLYVLPKILNDKVFLQVNADLATKINIRDIGTSPNLIQVPDFTQKQFNQRSVIPSGATLILSGFKKVDNRTGAMQFMDMQPLGGRAASQQNVETIVLITPYILRGLA